MVVFFAWLVWLPMPFGSVIDIAQPLLITVPVVVCAAAALIRAMVMGIRPVPTVQTVPYRIWTVAAILFAIFVALQLVPLPPSTLRALSPQSAYIWEQAAAISSMVLGRPPSAAHPISIDPPATTIELFRFLAYFAAFQASALLVRRHRRRLALAIVLASAALFETLYGVHEVALRRYSIWGWENKLVVNRVTGTYVNPNHFGNYLAIILPLTVFIAAAAWHASHPGAPLRHRLVRLFESHFFAASFAVLTATACLVGILVSGSRGALLAVAGGFTSVAAMRLFFAPAPKGKSRRGLRTAKLAAFVAAGAIFVGVLVEYLGHERTVSRFKPVAGQELTLEGRVTGLKTAYGAWELFPLFGSGYGTFEEVASMTQRADLDAIFNHAHNDFAELAATTGTVGFMIAIVAVIAGYVGFVRMTFRNLAASWNRHAYQLAALTSITIAIVHALFDFNFYIPANPATLAAIVGAAVAARDAERFIPPSSP